MADKRHPSKELPGAGPLPPLQEGMGMPPPWAKPDRWLPLSVLVMLAGMTYHLWVLDHETEQLALGFGVLAAVFVVYDWARPLRAKRGGAS